MCYQKVADVFEKNGVILPDYDKFEEFKTECGIYLYLLLLNRGFPKERMVILTGNKGDAENLLKHNHLSTDVIIEKGNGKYDFNKRFYGEKSPFYAVRRLVFSAANHWENKLNELEAGDKPDEKAEDKIAFNKLYFAPEAKYTIDDFITLLDKIKLLFENMVPSDEESVYYHAMHIFASFHEEKADFKKIKSKPNLYPYHSMIRFFRNWSSHNLFEENKMSADEFALLFCIALRTYFDGCQINEEAFNKKILDYEDLYFNFNQMNITQKNYTELAKQVLKQVTIFIPTKSIPIKINCTESQKVCLATVLADKDIEGNAKLQNIFCLLIDGKFSYEITYQITDKNDSKIINVTLQSNGTEESSECDDKKEDKKEDFKCDIIFKKVAAELIARKLNTEKGQKELITVSKQQKG